MVMRQITGKTSHKEGEKLTMKLTTDEGSVIHLRGEGKQKSGKSSDIGTLSV